MMRRRAMPGRRGRGLVGAIATTAVVAGTATVTHNAINRHQQGKQDAAQQEAYEEQGGQQEADEQQQLADMQQQMADLQAQQVQAQVAPAAPVAAAPAGTDMMAQLTQLGQLQQSGILSPEEFTAAKAKLLGM